VQFDGKLKLLTLECDIRISSNKDAANLISELSVQILTQSY